MCSICRNHVSPLLPRDKRQKPSRPMLCTLCGRNPTRGVVRHMTLRRVLSRGTLLILTTLAVGIGESVVSALPAQTISSAVNQSFYVGAVSTTASAITITDPNSKITPGKDIHIYFPAALALDWDNTVTTLTLAGSAAGKVNVTPIYSANGDSVRINVTAPWVAGDQLIITNLAFRNFT